MTDMTQNQEQLILQNDDNLTKIDNDDDLETNGHSHKVSYPSYVSYKTTEEQGSISTSIIHCHYCDYAHNDEKEVKRHSIISHPGKLARPDSHLLKLINNKSIEKEE
jgi:hypothetical protein